MKPKKKKTNKTLIAIIITTFSALILAGVFFCTYFYVTDKTLNSYERSVKEVVDAINATNKNTKGLLKDNTPNLEACKKRLPEIIVNLKDAKIKLEGLVPGDKFKLQHAAIKDGLNNNILMYTQILNIIQNPGSKDISDSIQDFTRYRDDSENSYSQFGMSGMTISVLSEANDFLKAFEAYANLMVSVKKDSDLKASQTLDFCTKVDELIAKFVPIKTDFAVELKKARDKSSSYDAVITLANSYKDSNSAMERDLDKLRSTMPASAKSVKDGLNGVLDSYDQYIQSFLSAVNNEKSQSEAQTDGTSLTEDKLKEIYSDPNNAFLNVQDKYDNFLKLFSDYKNANVK